MKRNSKYEQTTSSFNLTRMQLPELPEWATRMVNQRLKDGRNIHDATEPVRAVMMRVIDESAHVIEHKIAMLEEQQKRQPTQGTQQLIVAFHSYVDEILDLKTRF